MIVYAFSSSDLRDRSIFWVDSCPSTVWGKINPHLELSPETRTGTAGRTAGTKADDGGLLGG